MNRVLKRLCAVALLAASFALAYLVIRFQHHVELFIRSIGPFVAYPVAIAVFAAVASAPFSVTDALAIMNGAIFGPLWGSIVNAIGLVFAAMLGYWINQRASHLFDLEAALERLPAWVKRFPVGSPMFLIGVRVIPGFGGTVATATAATFKVPIWVHVWTMCAIAVPLCTILAIFGDRATVLVRDFEHAARQHAQTYCREHRCPDFHLHFHRGSPRPEASPA